MFIRSSAQRSATSFSISVFAIGESSNLNRRVNKRNNTAYKSNYCRIERLDIYIYTLETRVVDRFMDLSRSRKEKETRVKIEREGGKH